MKRGATVLVVFALTACGSGEAPGPNASAPPQRAPVVTASAPPPPAPLRDGPVATTEEVWARVSTDVVACYEAGRRAIPGMVDGRIAFDAAIEPGGRTACVVPSDDTGLTQEVADCIRERLERESYEPARAPWSARIPIVVRAGVVSLGGPAVQTSIDTIESRGLAEDLYPVLDALLPDVKRCVRDTGKTAGRRVVVVGARVRADGGVACAVASSTSPLPDEVRGCLTTVFSRARFAPPKRGLGLLSVPIEVTN